jgi:hypothetical protein
MVSRVEIPGLFARDNLLMAISFYPKIRFCRGGFRDNLGFYISKSNSKTPLSPEGNSPEI